MKLTNMWWRMAIVPVLLCFSAPVFAQGGVGYVEAEKLYRTGDHRGAIAALEGGWTGQPQDALLLGLAFLQIDSPSRAADAWTQFIRRSPDRRLAGEVARLRTLVVREANRRAVRGAGEAAAPSEDRIVVLPFRNVGSPELDPLGRAIAAMIAESLGALPGKRVIGPDRTAVFFAEAARMRGSERTIAARTGRMLDAGNVITGAQVDSTAEPRTIEVTSAVVSSSSEASTDAGSFLAARDRFASAVRETTLALAEKLGATRQSLSDSVSARVSAVYTANLEAALAFGRGIESESLGDFDVARREYESALEADPSFALARNRLSVLPASGMSMAAIALAVESELPEIESASVAPASDTGEEELAAVAVGAGAPTDDGIEAVEVVEGSSVEVATVGGGEEATGAESEQAPADDASEVSGDGTTAAEEAPATADASEPEEENTILGMSPMTAALVAGGTAVVIGGAAAALGGGGGGGDGGGGEPQPPTLSGVEDRNVVAGATISLDVTAEDPEGASVSLAAENVPAAATFNATSGNPARGLFRWVTSASDVGAPVEVSFVATADRSGPANQTSATARLSVQAPAPTPGPPPACGDTGASCSQADDCCQDVTRACEQTPGSGGTSCCLEFGSSCGSENDCCGVDADCREQQCCAPLTTSCSVASDCCDRDAACEAGRCCASEGASCGGNADCCDGRCSAGVCESGVVPTPAPTPPPAPTPTATAACADVGVPCFASAQCCERDCGFTPTSGRRVCCTVLGDTCSFSSECCGQTSVCAGKRCCLPAQAACSSSAECCGDGAACEEGRCCVAPGRPCSRQADCCTGSCNAGFCSGGGAASAGDVSLGF
jgi:tetratricopeptide (TPR) repeat protein